MKINKIFFLNNYSEINDRAMENDRERIYNND